jgi:DNA-binding NarL/FixJ family response regulator
MPASQSEPAATSLSGAAGPVRVFVIDDNPHLLTWVSRWIRAHKDIVALAGVATSTQEARPLVAASAPDVVLLDFRLGPERATAYTRELRSAGRRPYVIIHTGFTDRLTIQAALGAGANGVIGKDADPDELLRLLVQAGQGDVVLSKSVRRAVADTGPICHD